ncbi:hypothetical protein AYJ54_00525 [Bradyrhizobium centrolobii]|uniref:Uncharacterized protein n=1 Tax=Bradyrhizobium centrolobii TaxID=1505087 RepID=A0A176YFL6_9BRAD|nr:hypothetical protein AYJ54_00525 [Bradyrhizobium centrolobii]
MNIMTHFGNPCIHCDIAHDEVEPGPCKGDSEKAIVLAYCVWRQAWQNPGSGCDTVRCKMSDGSIRDDARHPAEHWACGDWFKNAEVLAPHEFKARFLTGVAEQSGAGAPETSVRCGAPVSPTIRSPAPATAARSAKDGDTQTSAIEDAIKHLQAGIDELKNRDGEAPLSLHRAMHALRYTLRYARQMNL